MKVFFMIFVCLLILGCAGIPDGISPVDNFELNRYLGKWYEIARLDHSFERGLSEVTAEYSLRDDGKVTVNNRGFLKKDNKWKDAKGIAKIGRNKDEGYFKVSFFRPFYSSYIIFELDENYQYAFISGPSKSYLWLLSRTPEIDEKIKEKFVEKAKELGFDTDSLIFVEHSQKTEKIEK
jgi:apolipoprotein D and lipocalin family protein